MTVQIKLQQSPPESIGHSDPSVAHIAIRGIGHGDVEAAELRTKMIAHMNIVTGIGAAVFKVRRELTFTTEEDYETTIDVTRGICRYSISADALTGAAFQAALGMIDTVQSLAAAAGPLPAPEPKPTPAATVVTLRGEPATKLEPVADVVTLLDGLLAEAKRGELRLVAFAAAAPDGTTRTGWSNGPGYSAEIMAAISDLFHRFAHMRLQTTEDVA